MTEERLSTQTSVVDRDGCQVAIWPDHVWVSTEETRDFADLCVHKSDDYYVVYVDEWEADGSPAARYFL